MTLSVPTCMNMHHGLDRQCSLMPRSALDMSQINWRTDLLRSG
jgi:hypothetical protein